SVSHDLRAPLRGIMGFSKILLEDRSPPIIQDAQKTLISLVTAAIKMNSLITVLLGFSRLGGTSLTISHVNLDALVKDLMNELKPSHEGRKVNFKVSELGTVDADPGLLKQVFENFLSNAIKYSRNKNPAEIEIGMHSEDAQERTFFFKD